MSTYKLLYYLNTSCTTSWHIFYSTVCVADTCQDSKSLALRHLPSSGTFTRAPSGHFDESIFETCGGVFYYYLRSTKITLTCSLYTFSKILGRCMNATDLSPSLVTRALVTKLQEARINTTSQDSSSYRRVVVREHIFVYHSEAKRRNGLFPNVS